MSKARDSQTPGLRLRPDYPKETILSLLQKLLIFLRARTGPTVSRMDATQSLLMITILRAVEKDMLPVPEPC
jgi:hypothetical protein